MHAMHSLSIIDSLYEAGFSGADWSSIGQELCTTLGAHSGSLRLGADGRSTNVFHPTEVEESVYAERYLVIDPVRAAAARIKVGADWSTAVTTSDDLLPAEIYHRSEFYRDFAQRHGQDHILLGALGDEARTVVGFFRETSPFGDDERHALVELMPHMQRAVQLQRRLGHLERDIRLGGAAFEALSGAAIVLDGDLNILFANSTAEQLLDGNCSPFFVAKERSPFGPLVKHLSLRNRTSGSRFRALVTDAATGGSGGAMRIEADDGLDDLPSQLAVMVSPQPTGYPRAGGTCPVLVLVKELSRPSPPPASLLGDLFGLSTAEQAVAIALLGGQTAEHVASERLVSLDTVRSQIRNLLRKSDAANLRDFERMGAVLSAFGHQDRTFAAA